MQAQFLSTHNTDSIPFEKSLQQAIKLNVSDVFMSKLDIDPHNFI